MKGAGKIVLGISMIVALLLVYVHEQFLVFQVSYSLAKKSSRLAEKGETYRRIKYEVDQMKAPRLLEEKMSKLSLDLTLPKEVRVLKIPAPHTLPSMRLSDVPIQQPVSGRLMNLLGRWIDVAQAKTDN